MKIVNMNTLDAPQLEQAAQILHAELPLSWETLDEAREEVRELLNDEPDAVLLAAVENGEVLGWCGILSEYDGNVFELHPLVVRHDCQRKGIGTHLVNAITDAAREKGGLTLSLGADDDLPGGETSLANTNLYDDLPRHIKEFEPGTHQTAFYMKLGFKIIGVMPDANGIGKPDIFMAKSLK